MKLEFSHIYRPLFIADSRYIHLWGGRGRGGSFTSTQYFLHLITMPQYFRGFIMREIFGDIRDSLWADLKDRIEEAEITDLFDLNESTMTATFLPNGNTIVSKGFKKSSSKQTAKLKSMAGATHVLIEEMEEISEDDFKQLDDTLRTTKIENIQIIGVFNPPHKNHWIWKTWYILEDSEIKDYYRAKQKKGTDLISIFSTYEDNLINLNQSFIKNQEAYKESDEEYYYTVVKGLISEGVRGRIYKGWKSISAMPNLYEKFYGLDFGFNDPVALIECEAHNKTLYADEKLYQSGLTNSELSEAMKAIGISKTSRIYADSSEPKSIYELKSLGWNIVPAQKGPDSIRSGIKFLKQFDIFVTEASKNIWFESQNYHWRLVNKEPIEEPEDANNHLMDALRYSMDKLRKTKTLRVI